MTQVIAEFYVKTRTEMDEKLNAAVRDAAQIEAGFDRRCGLLVVRHDFDHFSVSISPDVPFGSILESDSALGQSHPKLPQS